METFIKTFSSSVTKILCYWLYFLIILLFYLFISGHAGSSLTCRLFSSWGEQRLLFIAVLGLLSAVASRCGAGLRARGLRGCSPQALEHRLSVVVAWAHSCSATCGIFPDQASNSRLWHWQVDSLPLSPQGSLNIIYFKWRRKESFIPFILPE